MYNPTRGGTRGGAGLFSWEDVKTDHYRQNYIGHSLHAPAKGQQGKDLFWYAKEGKRSESKAEERKKELALIKAQEQEYLSAALGNKHARLIEHTADETLLKETMQRAKEQKEELQIHDGENGVGFGRARHTTQTEVPSRLEGTGVTTAPARSEQDRTSEVKQERRSTKASRTGEHKRESTPERRRKRDRTPDTRKRDRTPERRRRELSPERRRRNATPGRRRREVTPERRRRDVTPERRRRDVTPDRRRRDKSPEGRRDRTPERRRNEAPEHRRREQTPERRREHV